MSITKAHLVESLSSGCGLNKQDAKVLVDDFFTEISDGLVRGAAVKLSEFGNFTVRDKKARPGLNPRTGVKTVVDSRRVATFRAGAKLKNLVTECKETNKCVS